MKAEMNFDNIGGGGVLTAEVLGESPYNSGYDYTGTCNVGDLFIASFENSNSSTTASSLSGLTRLSRSISTAPWSGRDISSICEIYQATATSVSISVAFGSIQKVSMS